MNYSAYSNIILNNIYHEKLFTPHCGNGTCLLLFNN